VRIESIKAAIRDLKKLEKKTRKQIGATIGKKRDSGYFLIKRKLAFG